MSLPVAYLAGGAAFLAYQAGKTPGGLLGAFQAAVDPDALLPGEAGPAWVQRIGRKYWGQEALSIPEKTRAACIAWDDAIRKAVNEQKTPIDGPGIPVVSVTNQTNMSLEDLASPKWNIIVYRDGGKAARGLAEHHQRWITPGFKVYTTTVKYERNWGVFGTGIQLGQIVAVGLTAIGSIFGPAGTALGAGVGAVLQGSVLKAGP